MGIVRAESRVTEGVKDSILDVVCDTPLVRLSRIGEGLAAEILGKVECLSPGGSIKDRVAVAMIEAAERDGLLRPGGTIVEPTSGNTGVGLVMAGCLKGYRVIAVMPDKMSREKIDLLHAYGARVVMTPTEVPPDSPQSYYSVADRLTEEISGAFQPNQYKNRANPDVHFRTTGPDLWRQAGGRITHFVASVGTGGTISGVGRFLKSVDPQIQVIGADPIGSIYSGVELRPYLVEGIGKSTWPDTLDRGVVDRFVGVSDHDSFATTRELARREGILAGGSAGTAMFAALELARELDDPSACIAVILPDSGRSYISKVYSDAWMAQYGFLTRAPETTVGAVLATKHTAGNVARLVCVECHSAVRAAVALLHEHGVSQLPVISGGGDRAIVGSVSERGLLKQTLEDPALLGAEVVDVMEPPLPTASVGDAVDEAVALLAGETQALVVTDGGRPAGILTRTDLLELLVDASGGGPSA